MVWHTRNKESFCNDGEAQWRKMEGQNFFLKSEKQKKKKNKKKKNVA